MKVILLLCLASVALAFPQRQQAPLTPEEEQRLLEEQSPEPYQFSLQVNDDEFTNYQTRIEAQDENGVVKGEYSFVGPNGVRYITRYTADKENGYQAQTIEEQTDIKIRIPEHTSEKPIARV